MEEAYYSKDYLRVSSLSSSVLQSTFKEICNLKGIKYSKNEKFPALYKKVKNLLNLDPKEYNHDKKLKIFSSKMNVLMISINEIRNLYSESHGLSGKEYFSYNSLPPHHIKLIVDMMKIVRNFLIETHDYRLESIKI
ncbi:MAG TPA: abortive infection family protein [Atopostipes sp.]|nr:abortive infection family protein [Atopostipes sp.]